MKHTDVFNGSQVRMAYRDAVMEYAKQRSVAVTSKAIGSMVSSQEQTIWALPEGNITWTGGAWGVRASLNVEPIELRAAILMTLGVDLAKTKLFAKFAQINQSQESSGATS